MARADVGQMAAEQRSPARAALGRRWKSEGWHTGRTLINALEAGERHHPDASLIFASKSRPAAVTVADVACRGRRLAAALSARGVEPGDVMVMQLPNWAEWAIGWYAAAHAGLVVAPVVHIYGPAELGYIVRNSGARVLVTPDTWRSFDYLDRIARMGACPTLDLVVTVGERTVPGGVLWADLDAGAPAPAPAAPRHADDPCLLLYTSGTTAAPKGVVHSHHTLLAELATMAAELGRDGDSVFLNGGPAGHITGALTVSRPFLDGSTAVSMDAWDPEDAVELSLRHAVTTSVGAPVFLNSMLDVAERRGVDLPLHDFMLGAAAVVPDAVARADGAGVPGYRCYGSTEHPTISTGHPADPYDSGPTPTAAWWPAPRCASSTSPAAPCRSGPTATSSRSAPTSSSATSTMRSTPRPSPRTGGFAPATSAAWTIVAASPSPTAARTSSSAAGKTCRRKRSRTPWLAIPMSSMRPSSPGPTPPSASLPARSWSSAPER